ncbi:hypothetical protein [Mesorhizobium sp. CO1-1-9]|uniref:hypothetical protein n=1 Tax=Mesorhizobium sp. CO1-1-9 TaxID=2876630 RepID=UPI001CCA5D8A|nr:hypothetical protein [Mesorhizobium sp. CO1-1-9]MBZ9698814.1 hypothetical protein [Mesorhizobium sp. CO1-1-9]
MPVRRKTQKRSADITAAWAPYFEEGCVLLCQLDMIGVPTTYGIPNDAKAAGAAWHQYGPDFLASRGIEVPEPWALSEYGLPGRMKHAG